MNCDKCGIDKDEVADLRRTAGEVVRMAEFREYAETKAKASEAEVTRLKALVKEVEFGFGNYGDECRWCGAYLGGTGHMESCAGFTPEGEVR